MNDSSPADPSARTALELRAPEGAMQLEIDWADGHTSLFPHRILRGFCPCAHCQGHQGPIRFRAGGSLVIDDLKEVGNYAIQVLWADGHDTGIYSFDFLRRLCACARCAGSDPEARTYSR